MKKIILILLIAIYSQATWLDQPVNNNWNESTNTKFKYFVGLQMVDVVSTYYALHHGGVEANPLYGSNPKVGNMLLTKAVMIPLVYLSINHMNTKTADIMLNVLNVLVLSVSVNNVMGGMNIKF